MQIFFRENLAFFAVPKTGSAAFERALEPFADIIYTRDLRHLTLRRFHKWIAPSLDKGMGLRPERVAVIRDPVEHMRSWYRYRSRSSVAGTKVSTAEISFDRFVLDAINDKPPPHAQVGSQSRFLSLKDGTVAVHHLFAYDTQLVLRAWLEERFDAELALHPKKVSPERDAPLSREVRAQFQAARAEDFELYQTVLQAGGHLQDWSD